MSKDLFGKVGLGEGGPKALGMGIQGLGLLGSGGIESSSARLVDGRSFCKRSQISCREYRK